MKIYSPVSLSEALAFLEEHKASVCLLGGGTDFVVKYKEGLLKYNVGCNIYGIRELRFIKEIGDKLIIGALSTYRDIIDSPLVKKHIPLLAEACGVVGSPQIRNRGTIGGNIGTASPAGDTIPSLMVLGADLKLVSTQGERIVNIRNFFLGPGKTVLKPNEIITEIIVDKLKMDEGAFYSKLGMRNALAISIVGVAAKVKLSGNQFERVEFAAGSVGPAVIYGRMKSLEMVDLSNKELWDKAQLIKEEINPITDVRATAEYRKEMAASLLYQGLLSLRCQGGNSLK